MFALYFLVAMNRMTRPNTPYLALVINCAFLTAKIIRTSRQESRPENKISGIKEVAAHAVFT